MKRFPLIASALILFALLIIGLLKVITESKMKSTVLNFAIGGPWINLHPGLQHTVWADIVLSNKFEALVGTDERGLTIPRAASSWRIYADQKTYEFDIDTTKQFSDGSFLTAKDFKDSWENSLKLSPASKVWMILPIVTNEA